MGLSKKMEWLKWIKKYSGMLDTKKTSSMETLIESVSSKTVNYAYNYSSAITDDEFTNAAAPQQRPMLPPPPPQQDTSQDAVPPSPTAQHPNDIYDCCVLLDGIPIKHEFQYTLSNIGGRGKITKDDIEGLASKILESMYGTTAKFSSEGQRTVTVILNVVRQPVPVVSADSVQSWSQLQSGRERKSKISSAAITDKQQSESLVAVEPVATAVAESVASAELLLRSDRHPTHCPVKKISSHHRAKPEMRWYNRRDELIRLLQKNLAESLSFQNLRKSNRPEGYQRVRSKRRQSVSTSVVGTLQTTPLPSPPTSVIKTRQPAKVDWSPYDFEPAAHIPSHHYHHQQRKNARNQHYQQQQQKQQQLLYGGRGGGTTGQRHVEEHQYAIKSSPRAGRQYYLGAVVSSKSKDAIVAEEHTKDMNHQRYKRAKMALKKLHHHTHEHHHYHHYDYYNIV